MPKRTVCRRYHGPRRWELLPRGTRWRITSPHQMTALGFANVKILAVCDDVDSRLYGNGALGHRPKPDLLLSCGDLPPYYLDYLVSKLDVPMYAIHGNH